MDDYLYVLVFSLVGGLLSLVGGALLITKKSNVEKLIKYATPFAAGGLLAAVFLDLLSEGVSEGEPSEVLLACLLGILAFFLAERFLHWFHHHHDEDEARKNVSKNLIIFGDFIHNALDGVAIAAAFLISVPTGIITAVAVAAHEIPQEIGDFGLLLSRGMSRKRVLIVNMLTALSTTAMALPVYWLGSAEKLPIGIMLGLSAGFLLYIAMSDIIPTIHQTSKSDKIIQIQPLMLLIGVITVGFAIIYAHQYIDAGHENDTAMYSQVNAHNETDDH